jgi:hypothetical protein
MTHYHELTKADVAALRQCDQISVHYAANDPSVNACVAFKRLERRENDPFGDTERRHAIGDGSNIGMAYRYDAAERNAHARCFALVSNYASQHTPEASALATLRVGDAIAWEFAPDAGSNGYAAVHGLHIDELILRVRRGGKDHASWTLATCCCPSNSARMVKGVADSESYKRDAQRVRENV